MKVKTKNLVEFLKKIKMEGTQQIDECLLDFQESGLKINVNSPSKMSRAMGWFKTKGFEEYNSLGKVGVNDLNNFIKVLERFSEKISISKQGNLLTVKGKNKKVEIELVSEDFLSVDSEPTLEFDDKFNISSKKVKEIFKDVQMNKDVVLDINTKPKQVIFSNTGKYKFQNILDSDETKGGVKVSFGEPLIECINNLTGNIEFNIKSDYPAKIMEKTDISSVTLIVAPRVDEKE